MIRDMRLCAKLSMVMSMFAAARIEDDDFIMVAGSARPLIDAFRLAHVELIEWLEADHGFDRQEAYQVLSQVGAATVANIVDPQYTVAAKFPNKYLPRMD